MVSKATIQKRQNARWDGGWFRREGNGRGQPDTGACFDCKAWTPYKASLCAYGTCTEIYCGQCGHFSGGWGPVGCPCDHYGNTSGGKGHHTRAEQVGAHFKLIPNPDEDEWAEPFLLRPLKKRKPSKRWRR
jgi:hypothetical protein